MSASIYLDEKTSQRLAAIADRWGESRNALIRRVLNEWIEHHAETPVWPCELLDFSKGMPEIEPIESRRPILFSPNEP